MSMNIPQDEKSYLISAILYKLINKQPWLNDDLQFEKC